MDKIRIHFEDFAWATASRTNLALKTAHVRRLARADSADRGLYRLNRLIYVVHRKYSSPGREEDLLARVLSRKS